MNTCFPLVTVQVCENPYLFFLLLTVSFIVGGNPLHKRATLWKKPPTTGGDQRNELISLVTLEHEGIKK